jgi:hypothetical protein
MVGQAASTGGIVVELVVVAVVPIVAVVPEVTDIEEEQAKVTVGPAAVTVEVTTGAVTVYLHDMSVRRAPRPQT